MLLCLYFTSRKQMPRAFIVPHHFLKRTNVPTWHGRHTDKIIRPEMNCVKFIYLHSRSFFSAVNKCKWPPVLLKCVAPKTRKLAASTLNRTINKGQYIVRFITELQ